MSYQTYITEALVCGSYESKSSDKSFLLFTREAGMLHAHAKSVREERSKHRYALQACSHIRATLVRGKSGWKITGAESLTNFYAQTNTREARAVLRNTILLLRRVIHGETAHTDIFDDVVTALSNLSFSRISELEQILALRILHGLGYIAPHAIGGRFLHVPLLEVSSISLTDTERNTCTKIIEKALHESQL